VAERLNAPVLKTGIGGNLDRGFESHPRRFDRLKPPWLSQLDRFAPEIDFAL
jgi:hypothetical protein